jgi:NAD(P)-dependent dehydrogenase (short-subunit alcohol dehydrogenase family)
VSGRVVVVTGASRGLGSDLARGLAETGATVVGVARTPVDDWELGSADHVDRRICDIVDESAVKRLFSGIRGDHGQLDLVVNNAGVFSGDLLLIASAARFAEVLSANLIATHVVTREAVKLMRPRGTGRVVSISSIATQVPVMGNALYASGKASLERLMRDYAVEFRGSGVTFNSIAVSFFEHSRMVASLKPEARADYESRLLVPRPVQLGEVLAAINYLASDEAATVTGQVVSLGSPF